LQALGTIEDGTMAPPQIHKCGANNVNTETGMEGHNFACRVASSSMISSLPPPMAKTRTSR